MTADRANFLCVDSDPALVHTLKRMNLAQGSMSVRQPLKPRFIFPRESQGRRQKKFFKEYKMNAVFFPRHCSGKGAVKDIAAFNDAGDCIESWGIRRILSGRLFGFALGGVLVAFPLTAGVLAFGTIGTSIVDAIECAVIAGGFGALAAAFYDQGAVRGSTMQFERKLTAGVRLPADANRQHR